MSGTAAVTTRSCFATSPPRRSRRRLASPSAKLKIEAIDAISDLELQALADQVFERLNDDDDRVAASAAVAVLHGYQQAPQVADDMLKSENAEARRIAVAGIAKKIGKLAVADIEKAGSDPDAGVRRAAIYALGEIKDKDAVELCTRRMKDPDEACAPRRRPRSRASASATSRSSRKHALADKALSVRLAGVELLAAAHRDASSRHSSTTPIRSWRVAAAIAVKTSHPGLGAKAARARSRCAGEWTVRAGAANLAVSALGARPVSPTRRRLAKDSELEVRLAAARVLVHAGDTAGARAISRAALEMPQAIQAAADLAAQGDATGLAALSAAVRDSRNTRSSVPRRRGASHRTSRDPRARRGARRSERSGTGRGGCDPRCAREVISSRAPSRMPFGAAGFPEPVLLARTGAPGAPARTTVSSQAVSSAPPLSVEVLR